MPRLPRSHRSKIQFLTSNLTCLRKKQLGFHSGSTNQGYNMACQTIFVEARAYDFKSPVFDAKLLHSYVSAPIFL
jgi:hypothetical protein